MDYRVPAEVAQHLFHTHLSQNGFNGLNYRCDMLLAMLISYNHIQLDFFPFRTESFCGMLSCDKNGAWSIVTNNSHPPERRNFTIGHELGHYYLHRHKQSQFADRAKDMLDSSDLELEREANIFAAELVLPESVIKLMISYRYSFNKIKKATYTSYECLKWRLVTHLMQNYNLSRSDSLIIIDDYRYLSNSKSHHESAFFKIIFPAGRIYRIVDGELVEFSPTTNKSIAVVSLYPKSKGMDFWEETNAY